MRVAGGPRIVRREKAKKDGGAASITSATLAKALTGKSIVFSRTAFSDEEEGAEAFSPFRILVPQPFDIGP